MKQPAWMIIASLFLIGSGISRADEKPSTGHPRQITVHLREYQFEPAQIVLKAGEKVELTLMNDGTMMHEFITEALKAMDVEVEINGVVAETRGVEEMEIPQKARAVLHFTPETPGEFEIACRAKEPKDHYREGMRGRLLIQ